MTYTLNIDGNDVATFADESTARLAFLAANDGTMGYRQLALFRGDEMIWYSV